MSTRYVWEKHVLEASYTAETPQYVYPKGYLDYLTSLWTITAAPGYRTEIGDDGTVTIVLTGETLALSYSNAHVSAIAYPYLLFTDPYGEDYFFMADAASDGYWNTKTVVSQPGLTRYGFTGLSKDGLSQSFYQLTHWTAKGALDGYVSAGDAGAYPADGVSGGNYYVLLGGDGIDPAAVGYSSAEPKGGESVTVTVAPSADNEYGGVIVYAYQYAVDGGSWTSAGSATTALIKTLTVPEGANSFRVRVRASDAWGFTSADWVYGATLGVRNLAAYIGVNGVAREIERIYVGVNGVAREAASAYAGVNGVAREIG